MKTILITSPEGALGNQIIKDIRVKYKQYNNRIVLLSAAPIKGYINILHNNYNFSTNDFYKEGIFEIDIILHLDSYNNLDSKNNIDKASENICNIQYLVQHLPNKPQKLIFLSSTKVIQPSNLYGWSLVFCEKYIEEWCRQKNIIVQVLRIGNKYKTSEEMLPVSESEKTSFLPIKDTVNEILESFTWKAYQGPIDIG